jgi:pSer/pThr/pTyr-binding forkhead associated (FHA) protein
MGPGVSAGVCCDPVERVNEVGFTLTIMGGSDQGKNYTFDRVEITIGRTMDNDVVLPDPGISRQHMSIRDKGGAYILKDLGSSNGTKLNGKGIREEVLRPGDIIEAGGAKVRFEGPTESKQKPAAAKQPVRGRRQPSTRAKGKRNRRQPGRPVVRKGAGRRVETGEWAEATQPPPSGDESTDTKKPEAKSVIRSKGARVRETKSEPEKEVAKQVRRKSGRARGSRAKGRKKGKAKNPSPISNVIGIISTKFKALDKKLQIAILAVVAIMMVFAVIKLFQGGKKIIQVVTDNSDKIFTPGMKDSQNRLMSFGVGDVDVRCVHSAQFKFSYANGRSTALFAVAGIDNKSEVAIQLNGIQIGVAPITMGKWSEGILLNLPRKHLLENEENKLVFINTINYADNRANEEWAVKLEYVSETPLPSPNRKAAEDNFKIAKDRYKTMDVAPRNMYEALEHYKKTRDYLELLDEGERPDIYLEAIEMIGKIELDLEQKFRNLMFTAEKKRKFKQHAEAKELFHQIMLMIPNEEDPRFIRAAKQFEMYK